jgi:hypothetical protein
MQQVIVDVSQNNVSFDSTSLVSMVPASNKVSFFPESFFMAKVFGIDMAGDKVIMAPIISENPSYEENELKKYRDFSCMFCNLSHEKRLWKKGYFIGSWYHRNKGC